jgi:SAM-dependent methyltransferase
MSFSAEQLASMIAASEFGLEEQTRQIQFRRRLVERWRLAPGSRLLEIGCGQGDMTAVLADAVGPTGHITAVDLADPCYGAPSTIGESTERLSRSPLGDRIEFRFLFDVLDPANRFADDCFDAVVMAHCTWYFQSVDQLLSTFRAVLPWAPRLLLSEWDLQPASLDQLPHLLAVLIQGQVEAFKTTSHANVRTPYSRERLRELLAASGWRIGTEEPVDTSDLADGRWETQAALDNSLDEAQEQDLAPKFQALLRSQLDLLSGLATGRSLPAYSVIAERSP